MACAVTIVVMIAGFVTTAAPARAAFTSAYANLMIVGNGQDGTRTYSLEAGDVFTSPVREQMLAATKAVDCGAGVIHIV